MTEELQVHVKDDRTAGWKIQPPEVPDVLQADLTLSFELGGRDGTGQLAAATLRVISGARLQSRLPSVVLPVFISEPRLNGAVAECQSAWWYEVVAKTSAFRDGVGYTYHRLVNDVMPLAEFEAKILPELAAAGHKLFVSIFRPKDEGYEATRAFGEKLRELLTTEHDELRIIVRSKSFFAPWNLLYLGELNKPSIDHFLGMRHIVEHDIANAPLQSVEMTRPDRIAVHLNKEFDIEKNLKPFRAIADFMSLLEAHRLARTERFTKREFLDALRQGADESVFYFLCHGIAGDDVRVNPDNTALLLTPDLGRARDGITPSDIDNHLDKNSTLKGKPLVFLNSCRALKSGSIYYRGFAPSFLNADARAVIGPEIEMPVIFARDFAKRFFEEFFRGGAKRSIGRVLLHLRQDYLRKHSNPLGLTYSLYRGAAHYLPVGLSIDA